VRSNQDTLESRMLGNLARPVWGWGPGAIPGPTPLFAGNDEAAANHAKLWTLIASAERHGIDPQRYLTSVLAKLPFVREGDREELEQFLPDVWAKDDAAEPVPEPPAE